MSLFSIRVELHNAEWPKDYQTLHKAMTAMGFSTTVTDSTTRIEYHLPTAEYNAEGNYNVEYVTKCAIEAAESVGKKFIVFVTEGVCRRWTGLKEVNT